MRERKTRGGGTHAWEGQGSASQGRAELGQAGPGRAGSRRGSKSHDTQNQ
jgi:hypothetical protein